MESQENPSNSDLALIQSPPHQHLIAFDAVLPLHPSLAEVSAAEIPGMLRRNEISMTSMPLGMIQRPNEDAMACAAVVLKCKPPELTVREYLASLEQHVAKGRRENRLSSVYRHLDQSSYWQSQFNRVRSHNETVNRELIDERRNCQALKRRIDQLEAEVDDLRPANAKFKGAKKRKGDTQSGSKSVKNQSIPPSNTIDVEVERELELAVTDDSGNDLVRTLYQVNSLLEQQDQIENAGLTNHLVNAASLIPKMIQKRIESHFETSGSELSALVSTLTAARRAVSLLFTGVQRLQSGMDEERFRRRVIYAYADMLANLVNSIDALSANEIQRTAKPNTTKTPSTKDHAATTAVTKLLCSFVELLDPKDESHNNLFEAFAFIVLRKIGANLYTCAFNNTRGATIYDEIATFNTLEEADSTIETAEVTQAKLEAPYLVNILKRLMAATPAHLGAVVNTKTGKAKTVTKKSSLKGILTIEAKDKLQKTLLQCMFGTESDTDNPFAECLKMPSISNVKLPKTFKSKQGDVKDWFKEEVWNLLGWEILSREDIL